MKIMRWWLRLDRDVNISNFGLAALWFPLSVVYLSGRWSHHEGFEFYFFFISTLLFLPFWPLAIVRLIGQLKIHWLYSSAVFLPLVLLAISLAANLSTLTRVMLAASMVAPWPFLIVNSWRKSATESQASAGRRP